MTSVVGFDLNEIKKELVAAQERAKVLAVKPAKYSKVEGSTELVVSYKVGSKLKNIRELLRGSRCYAAGNCVEQFLSGEEVADRDDPNRRSDAYLYAMPELDEKNVTPMKEEEKADSFAWFVAIANKVAQPETLAFILNHASKKKNGTFAKNRLTVIAALPVVFGKFLSYYEIVGKAKTDTLLEVTIQERRFSEEEWDRTEDNEFLRYMASET